MQKHGNPDVAAVRCCKEVLAPARFASIVSIQGDGVLAIFGYPNAREDDARRATEAALELHAAVSRLAVPGLAASTGTLALHSGIHGWLVYLAHGDVERGRFAVGGDVSNTAARLSAQAERGQIYVSQETLGPDAHFFAISERLLGMLKGRTLPLPVYRILGRAPARSRFQARSMRFKHSITRNVVYGTVGLQRLGPEKPRRLRSNSLG